MKNTASIEKPLPLTMNHNNFSSCTDYLSDNQIRTDHFEVQCINVGVQVLLNSITYET